MTRHILIVGASGVIGAGAVEHFCRLGWSVSALSRRCPVVAADCAFTHVAADLTDAAVCAQIVRSLPPVTHLIYAAVAEMPGLVAGWRDEGLIERNGRMFVNLLDPLSSRGALEHVSLLQGAKAYGAHRHPVAVPCRESATRDPHPNFYWLHEDHLRERADAQGFVFTIFRPQVLLGSAPGAAMNLVAAIGAYAALAQELGLAFACPGSEAAVSELVDTSLLAEAFAWALATKAAWGETFNITNGDLFVPRDAWPHLCARFGLDGSGTPPQTLVGFFGEPGVSAAWRRLAVRHGLLHDTLPDLLGQSHHYVDLLWGHRIAARGVPVVLSTIKLRQAGFAACRDSLASLVHWLSRMAELRLLPPLER